MPIDRRTIHQITTILDRVRDRLIRDAILGTASFDSPFDVIDAVTNRIETLVASLPDQDTTDAGILTVHVAGQVLRVQAIEDAPTGPMMRTVAR